MATIAVLGTGRMGAALARRLLHTGHEVTVWNRTGEKVQPLVAAGARAAPTPAEAAAGADVVITMLTDAAAVREVVAQLAPQPGSLPPGQEQRRDGGTGVILVEMSTIGPAAVHALALPAGLRLVDAPVLGSVAAAEAGKLTILAGGDVDPVRSVLAVLGTVRECGPLGSGAAMKLVANTALVSGLAALADTIAVARSLGVDAESALSVVARGALTGAVARATKAGAAFPIALAVKDLELIIDAVSGGVGGGEEGAVSGGVGGGEESAICADAGGAEERAASGGAGSGDGGAALGGAGSVQERLRACVGMLRAAPDLNADLGTVVRGVTA